MRLSSVCFVYATLCVIVGMCLGIWMGVSEDHTLGPVHVHLNVIGWVSLAIIGLYHRSSGRVATMLDRVQAVTLMLGVPAFAGGLGVFLSTTNPTVERIIFPVGLAGTFLCLGAMILFLVIVIRDGRKPA
jgi:hypothetical protein